ncbi:hypothetical protein T11_5804 [Trichinella zimbabwensis]|uniref:Uncharacterized protein n=1 Tax=Trichinella zimbabwensis TaxID=268475 RepID=A0A0V1F457_9BILA|nr:hypothetical protein T11_5804 [Trichinella zimbabwensis]
MRCTRTNGTQDVFNEHKDHPAPCFNVFGDPHFENH